jgi:predicted transcriptional regulator
MKEIRFEVSDELRAAMESMARTEGKTLEQIGAEAMRRYVESEEKVRDLNELMSWGQRHARDRNYKPSDVESAIADIRRGR